MKTNLKVNFKVLATNNKGEVSISLTVKGELTDEQILSLHRLKAVGAVFVDMFDGQASIDDYEEEEPRRGLAYTLKGADVVVDNQLTIDEYKKLSPLHIDGNADIINDGEPSEDEKEIESMESEVSQEERAKGDLEDELPF